MNLINIPGLIKKPPASDYDIQKVEKQMSVLLPNSYKELLRITNGLSIGGGLLIYGTDDIAELNEVRKTEVYAPGYVAIGDDGGGRVFLMHQGNEEKKVLIVDSGDMTPEYSDLISSDFIQWVDSGFSINADEMIYEIKWSENCKVVLIDTPDGGLKDLLKIRSIFGLKISTADLLKGSKNLPFIIVDEFPYGKAMKLVEKLGDIKIELRITK